MKEIIELYTRLFSDDEIKNSDRDEILFTIAQIAANDDRITEKLLQFAMDKVFIDCKINQAVDEIKCIRKAYGYSECVSKEEMGNSSLRLELKPHVHDMNHFMKVQREHLKGKSKMFKLAYELKRENRNNKIK